MRLWYLLAVGRPLKIYYKDMGVPQDLKQMFAMKECMMCPKKVCMEDTPYVKGAMSQGL